MTPKPLSRKAFLRLGLLAGIGGAAATLQYVTQPVGAVTYTRWVVRGGLQQMARPAVVALGECPTYQDDVLGCLRQLWQQAEMPEVRDKRILIKPNLVDTSENHPSTTSPAVVGAAIDLLREFGVHEITVGDGPAFRRDAWPIARTCGLLDVLESRNVPFVDLNYDDPRPVPVKDGWLRRSPVLWLPRHVREADYIVSIPKLKTHHWATVSLSVKNLYGVVPGSRYGWPKNMLHMNNFIASILGVYQTVPKVLAVVDGIVGMEGDGPLFGDPVPHGLLAIGKDAVAVDSICAQLMGFDLKDVQYLSLADWAGIGKALNIETRGATYERMQRHYRHVELA